MDFLKRELAPLTADAWKEIDDRAVTVLNTHLSARRVIPVRGPYGWNYTVLPEGRLELKEEDKKNGVRAGCYRVKPLVEARVSFRLDRWEMDNLVRGASDISLDSLDKAVEQIALFEEQAVYNGYKAGGITGLLEANKQKTMHLGAKGPEIMEALSRAILDMKNAHQNGPFSLIVGNEGWKRVNTEIQGYPLIKRIRDIVGGSVLYSSVMKGAVMIPQDHPDLELVIGGDYSIGYEYHDAKTVQLFISESFTFRVTDPSIIISFTE